LTLPPDPISSLNQRQRQTNSNTNRDGTWVVPANYYQNVGKDGFMQKPIGAGPYKQVSHQPGVRLDFAAFEGYYRPVHVMEFTMLNVPAAATRVAMLERGEAENTGWDSFGKIIALLGLAIPGFWLGLVMILVFSVWLE